MSMNILQKPRYGTNWETELLAHDTAVKKDGGKEMKVVFLAGLQRLAQIAGLVESDCQILTPSDQMVQAIYKAKFSDGTSWVGTADCNSNNTKGIFLHYPTAVAESRAEARCLRKALGIRLLSSEEVGFMTEGFGSLEASPSAKADNQIIAAIQKLCETRNIDVALVLEEVIQDKNRASSIFELSELTTEEAQRALAWLNDQKPRKKPMTAKEERDARKAELQSKQESNK
jgi:hypothetical protein